MHGFKLSDAAKHSVEKHEALLELAMKYETD